MARVVPSGWRELQASGAALRELETLGVLADGLPDEYTVFHGVHWTRIERRRAIIGEIDFAVMAPSGHVLLIEQKAGVLREGADGLVKHYDNGDKNVPQQLARNADALRNRLRDACQGLSSFVDAILYCPDYQVRDPGTAGIEPARIVDSRRRDSLCQIIRQILPDDVPTLEARDRIERFLAEVLELVPDSDATSAAIGTLYTRLSGGLAHWARRIDCTPFRLRVSGAAGSGKTQLALALMQDAANEGRRLLYVCYNRPLADHVAQVAPGSVGVATYHQFGETLCKAQGEAIDFSASGAFDQIESALDRSTPARASQFDELIIDEGQDFRGEWVENLLRHLKPEGRAWLLEDPLQNLYDRAPLELAGWVSLRSDINYRSPAEIRNTINRLLPLRRPIEAGSPVQGSEVEIITYSDTRALLQESARAITRAYAAGFNPAQIALVTYRGRERSAFSPFDQLGPHSLRAPTGEFDLFGNAVYTEGDILIDSVHRFKGRSAPCVILTEIDFETLDEKAIRRIYVGATRASLKLTLLLSDRAAGALLETLPA
jgi:hypothetical protein